MPTRSRLVSVLLAFVISAATAQAGDLEGRGHTWTFEATAGAAVLDSGFNAEFFNYTVPSNPKVPPTSPDNLDSLVPTLGFRVGYNFTRFFGLEFSAASGETGVGDATQFTLEPDLTINDFAFRERVLQEQTQVTPLITERISGIDYDYLGGTLTAVFSFNNRPTSRWTFYFVVGGGAYSLDTDTGEFNDCSNVRVITEPGDGPEFPRIFNGIAPADVKDGQIADRQPDNPLQIRRFDLGCQRSFPTADRVRVTPLEFVFGQPIFRNSEAVLVDPTMPETSPFETVEGGECFDLLNCINEATDLRETPKYITQPGTVQRNSLAAINPIRSVTNAFFTGGGGIRYWVNPRQSIRADFRRNWDENNNKNINEIVLGYSFTLGRGRDVRASGKAPPPPAMDGDADRDIESSDADGDLGAAGEDALPTPADPPGDDDLPSPAADDPPLI